MSNGVLGAVADGPVRIQAMEQEAFDHIVRLASQARMLGHVHRTAIHDFNDSLNSLTLNVELLARVVDGEVPPDKKAEMERRCISALRQELKKLSAATTKALQISGQRDDTASRVAIATVVDEVLASVRTRANRQRVSITFEPPQQLLEVRGHTDELRLAAFNALQNAIEAMPDGGELRVDLRRDGPTAILAISDTGHGISQDIEAKIWDLLFSTRPGALGLGLCTMKAIVASHGGTVTFERRETGVTFVVRLPLIQ